jgi:hypothetical protein
MTTDWRAELRPAPFYKGPLVAPAPSDRCGCGHTRAAHAGRDGIHLSSDPAAGVWEPGACSLICCECEIFRGEADR